MKGGGGGQQTLLHSSNTSTQEARGGEVEPGPNPKGYKAHCSSRLGPLHLWLRNPFPTQQEHTLLPLSGLSFCTCKRYVVISIQCLCQPQGSVLAVYSACDVLAQDLCTRDFSSNIISERLPLELSVVSIVTLYPITLALITLWNYLVHMFNCLWLGSPSPPNVNSTVANTCLLPHSKLQH